MIHRGEARIATNDAVVVSAATLARKGTRLGRLAVTAHPSAEPASTGIRQERKIAAPCWSALRRKSYRTRRADQVRQNLDAVMIDLLSRQ
jgi:hypothetical protein